ncbi:MAG TPA: phosphoribosyltransferase family protein [Rhizomicrobium sp.]|nr:phosphoribosyltransferase family protein [Rhizomicrobium sp.]
MRAGFQDVEIPPLGLKAVLGIPEAEAQGLVIFAHGSGSGRLSPRNRAVAEALRETGFAALLLDLLQEGEELDRRNVFDIALLSKRLVMAAQWAKTEDALEQLAIGYFGASTGAAAALTASVIGPKISAIVSRGGRPDLAANVLARVTAPTLLIVGGDDIPVIAYNRNAFNMLHCEKEIRIVPHAGHLFEEPGTMEDVIAHAIEWFQRFLRDPKEARADVFADRHDAGRKLASALAKYKDKNAIVLALPRGGVPVAYEVAKALHAPLDVLLVRKIGAPGHPELGIGAVVDGANPQIVLNDDVVRIVRPSESYIAAESAREREELERRRKAYRGTRPAPDLTGRTVIVVDDGIATGGTARAVLKALGQSGAERIVLAMPVAPPETVALLEKEADEIVCLSMPEPFSAVGLHYRDFEQTTDEEVVSLLARAANI